MTLRMLKGIGISGFVLFVILLFVAWALPRRSFEVVHEGMTESEVRSLLGDPESSQSLRAPLWDKWCSWSDGTTVCVVYFVKGKVVKVEKMSYREVAGH